MVPAPRVELGTYWIIESKSVAILDELLVKMQIQKNHSLSGFVVYMVPAPRVELGIYWIIESKSAAILDELLVKIQIQKNH
ncbi:hypothetical protein TUM4641_12210 [Shewanella morhuae]|nr:hypothetical protein TUM4641_12210 [Shewanella morhuae]